MLRGYRRAYRVAQNDQLVLQLVGFGSHAAVAATSREPRGTSAYPPKPDAVAGAAPISGLCQHRPLRPLLKARETGITINHELPVGRAEVL
jgi:hypothetical protein